MHEEELHISNELVQNSWKKMEVILDREMPVRKKRRMWIYIPYAAALFLLIGAALVFKLYQGNPDPNLIESGQIAELKSDSPKRESEGFAAEHRGDDVLADTENTTASGDTRGAAAMKTDRENNELDEPSFAQNLARVQQPESLDQRLYSEAVQSEKSIDDLKNNEAEILALTNDQETSQEIAKTTMTDDSKSSESAMGPGSQNRNLEAMVFLQVATIFPDYRRDITRVPELQMLNKVKPAVQSQPDRHSWALYGSPILGNPGTLSGVDFGLSYGANFGSIAGIRLYSGLSYKSQQWGNPVSQSPGTNVPGGALTDTENENNNPTFSGGSQLYLEDYFGSLESTMHLEAGLMLSAQTGPINLAAGPKFSYLLDAKNEMTLGATSLSNEYLMASGFLEKVNWSLVGQASWMLTHRLSGHVAYHHRLTNLFRSQDESVSREFNSLIARRSSPAVLKDQYMSLGISFHLSP